MKLDKSTVLDLINRKIKKIFIYFYDAWCSGQKINISEDFEITEDMKKLDLSTSPFDVYVQKKDYEKFNWSIITRTLVADHTWKEKIRYIFSSQKVKDRCGCWSSFSFEKKKPKLNLQNLKTLKKNFKNNNN